MALRDLLTVAEADALRRGKPIEKGPTRLELAMDARPLTRVDEKQFKAEVYARDGRCCRCCGKKVIPTIARIPERREVHHIHGRTGDLRFESRAALQTCCECHEKITGRVNAHRIVIEATKTFEIRGVAFTDARFPVVFRELT